jgi:hypothetical protein
LDPICRTNLLARCLFWRYLRGVLPSPGRDVCLSFFFVHVSIYSFLWLFRFRGADDFLCFFFFLVSRSLKDAMISLLALFPLESLQLTYSFETYSLRWPVRLLRPLQITSRPLLQVKAPFKTPASRLHHHRSHYPPTTSVSTSTSTSAPVPISTTPAAPTPTRLVTHREVLQTRLARSARSLDASIPCSTRLLACSRAVIGQNASI